MSNERLPSDEHITAAREEAHRTRKRRQHNLRLYANDLIDELEAIVLTRAAGAGISNPDELLEYVEQLIAGRVIERRLAP